MSGGTNAGSGAGGPAGGGIPLAVRGRGSWVLFAVALTIAGVGYFSATSPDPKKIAHVGLVSESGQGASPKGAIASGALGPAPSYTELRGLRRGDNGDMYRGAVGALHAPTADLLATVSKTDADWTGALAQRQSRRAYAGAPPTIPHPIAQLAVNACLACHESGATIGGRVAPRMAHARYESCTQCHVPSVDPRPWNGPSAGAIGNPRTSGAVAANDFTGLASFGRGGRAHPGAPPTIPHPTFMRALCESCHGPQGLLGLRTPHPYQQSCTQCHAPSAALDQRVAFGEVR